MDARMDGFALRCLFSLLVHRSVLLLGKCSFVSGDEQFGGIMDLLELDMLQYEVEIVPVPVKEEDLSQNDQSSVVMTTQRGQRYQCILPDQTLDWANNGAMDRENIAFTDIPQLLKPLKEKCLFADEGWWTYKYCHGGSITQFHVEGGRVIGETVYLGHYDNEKVWTEEKIQKALNHRIKNRSADRRVLLLPSHDVQYINGTVCELTGQPRSVSVRLTCSPYHVSSEIVRVIEDKTCNYSLLIHTPFLCDHPLFMPESELGLSIVQCSPVLTEHKYNRYMDSLRDKKTKEEATVHTSTSSQEPAAPSDAATTETADPPKDTVPLMSILEILTDSIVKELTVESNGDKSGVDSATDNDGEISKELDDLIENLVTESLNKAFGISDKKKQDSQDSSSISRSNEKDFPGGPKSKLGALKKSPDMKLPKNKQQDLTKNSAKEKKGERAPHSEHQKQSPLNEGGRQSSIKEATPNDDTTTSRNLDSSSAASVLVSMLQDILNDGYLEYTEDSTKTGKDDQKFEKKRRKLEERYRTPWGELSSEDDEDD